MSRAAFVLGLGLGGFLDGIVLHQILRWHHLVSSTGAGADANLVADGLFHAATWLLTALGVWLLWRERRRADGRRFAGWLLLGWGAFNVADEAVFHALLDLHHIREGGDELAYDLAFLALALVQLAAGAALVRRREEGGAAV